MRSVAPSTKRRKSSVSKGGVADETSSVRRSHSANGKGRAVSDMPIEVLQVIALFSSSSFSHLSLSLQLVGLHLERHDIVKARLACRFWAKHIAGGDKAMQNATHLPCARNMRVPPRVTAQQPPRASQHWSTRCPTLLLQTSAPAASSRPSTQQSSRASDG